MCDCPLLLCAIRCAAVLEISHDVEYAPLPQTADEPEQAHPTSGEDSEGWHEELPSLPVSPIPAAFGKDTGDGTVIARVSSKEEREDAPLREDRAPLVGVEKNTESAGETSITSEESASSNDEADIPPPALPDVPPVEAAPAEERDPLKDLEDELAALEVFINEGGPTTREPGSPPADTAASSHLREPLATIKESEAEEASDEATTVACKELATTGKEAALDTCCQSASDALPGPTETLKLPQQEVPLPEPPIEKKPQQRHRKAPKPPPNAPPPKPPPRPGPSPDSAEKQEVQVFKVSAAGCCFSFVHVISIESPGLKKYGRVTAVDFVLRCQPSYRPSRNHHLKGCIKSTKVIWNVGPFCTSWFVLLILAAQGPQTEKNEPLNVVEP